MANGWYKESYRHALAARGVSTRKYTAAKTGAGRALERVLKGYDTRRKKIAIQGDLPERVKLAQQRAATREPVTGTGETFDQKIARIKREIASRGGGSKSKASGGRISESFIAKFNRWAPGHTNLIIGDLRAKEKELESLRDQKQNEVNNASGQQKEQLQREVNILDTNVDSVRKNIENLEELRDKATAKENLSTNEMKTLGEHTEAFEYVQGIR